MTRTTGALVLREADVVHRRKRRSAATLAAGLALAALAGLAQPAAAQSAAAQSRGSEMAILGGARTQQLSEAEMDQTRGGYYLPCVVASVCGFVGGSFLPGNWSWTSSLFSDIRRYYPQIWYPMFPLSYGYR